MIQDSAKNHLQDKMGYLFRASELRGSQGCLWGTALPHRASDPCRSVKPPTGRHIVPQEFGSSPARLPARMCGSKRTLRALIDHSFKRSPYTCGQTNQILPCQHQRQGRRESGFIPRPGRRTIIGSAISQYHFRLWGSKRHPMLSNHV